MRPIVVATSAVAIAFGLSAASLADPASPTPSAPPSWFLKDCEDDALRASLFDLYKKSEVQVKLFATFGNWWDIQEVDVMTDAITHRTGAGALWGVTNGRVIIHIPANANDKGVIFYEMFHGAFDHSPLEAQHDKWAADAGAAWCNAFRYLMEARYVPDSPWLAAVNKRMAAGVNLDITAPNPDLILFYCGKDYERFKAFWKERQAHPKESLDKFFATHSSTTPQ
jgi:hypothetical protein